MDREKALDLALKQIEKQFGHGALMKLGADQQVSVAAIPTGALSLDLALGIGGLPRGRVVEIFGPESSGKCLTADTYLWSDRGLETIEELFARCGQKASTSSRVTDISELGVRLTNENAELEPVAALTHNNKRSVIRLVMRGGREIKATANHPLRVIDESGWIVWRRAGEIEKGDVLVSALFGAGEAGGDDGNALSEDEAVLLGYLVGEGTLGENARNAVVFSNGDPQVVEEYFELMSRLFDATPKQYGTTDYRVHDTALRRRFADEYGLAYTNANGKTVPYRVRTAGAKAQAAFLSALYEADGFIEPKGSICITLASEQLCREVQLLLLGLGVPASLYQKWNKEYQRHYWTVMVSSGATRRFLDVVGFRSDRRAAQVARYLREEPREPQIENIPNMAPMIRAFRDAVDGDRELDRLVCDVLNGQKVNVSRSRLAAIVAWADSKPALHHNRSATALLDHFRHLVEVPYTFEPVTTIEDAGIEPTFDVVLPETHSFIANGILSHNTTLALHAIAEAQKLGGIAAFIDAEHALDPVYAKAIGIDVDELLVSQPDTGEQALEIADMLVRSGAVDIIVIDSVAALVPRAELEGEMGDSHVGLQARLMSQALRKLAGSLSKSKTCCVFINQLREKIGVMFGSPETTSGGRALKFYSSVRLDVRRIETLKDGTDYVGNRVRVKVAKNKVGSPFKLAEMDILFGEGISKEGSILDVGVDAGIVKKAGAWFQYDGEQLGQGRENARQFLKEHDDVAREIEKRAKEALGITLKPVSHNGDGEPALQDEEASLDDES